MEKNILTEINDIRRVMSLPLINEESLLTNTPLLTEGFVNDIMRDILAPTSQSFIKTVLTTEERDLIKRFLKDEIKTVDEKIKFSEFSKSLRGSTAISELRDAVDLAIQNGKLNMLGKTYWDRLLYRMEKTQTNWSRKKIGPLVPKIKDAADRLNLPHNIGKPISDPMEFFTVLSTHRTVFNEVRKSLSFFKEAISTRWNGVESQLDKIMLNLESAITEKTWKAEETRTQIRQIGLQIMGLKKQAKQQYFTIIDEIETAVLGLKDVNGNPKYKSKDVKRIISQIKKQSAFENIFKEPSQKSNLWLWDIFSESSYANTLRNIRDVVKTKGRTIMTLIHRGLMFMYTGHVRTFSEITQFCIDDGFAPGLAKYFAWLYTMKYFIIPTMTSIKDLGWVSFKQLIGDPDYTEEDWGIMVKKYYLDPLTHNFTDRDLGDKIMPFNYLWDNLGRGADKNAQEKIYEEFVAKFDQIAEKNGLTKEQMAIIKDRVKRSTNVKQTIEDVKKHLSEDGVASVINTKAGFISWCITQKPPLTPDPANPWIKEPIPGLPIFTEYGLTNDGKRWSYDDKTGTFVPL